MMEKKKRLRTFLVITEKGQRVAVKIVEIITRKKKPRKRVAFHPLHVIYFLILLISMFL